MDVKKKTVEGMDANKEIILHYRSKLYLCFLDALDEWDKNNNLDEILKEKILQAVIGELTVNFIVDHTDPQNLEEEWNAYKEFMDGLVLKMSEK